MTPKYYTPEIEEFHVGFECEVDYEGWEKTVIIMSSINPSLCASISRKNKLIHIVVTEDTMNEYRVKHLDREDIQECGWECRLFNQSYNSGEFIINNKYILIFNIIDSFCIVKHINFPEHVEKNIISVFQGTIKNKSELKKIMLQLGIN